MRDVHQQRYTATLDRERRNTHSIRQFEMNELASGTEKNNPIDARPRDGVHIVEKRRRVYFNGIGDPRCGNRRVDAAGRTYWLAFHPAHISVAARMRASTVYELYCGWGVPCGTD